MTDQLDYVQRLERAARAVEQWWLEQGKHAFLGAPAAIFSLRSVLSDRPSARKFGIGERVRKIKGSSWQGRIVGFYSTDLTPIGYCVESEREPGSVQIYPETALEKLNP